MGRGLEWVDAARADAQVHVAEPIVAVGFLQPGGSWGAFGASKLNPIAGSLGQADANKAAGGLAKAGGFKPKVAMLAVTADSIHVFSASPARKRSLKVGDLLASWSRDDVTCALVPGRIATQVNPRRGVDRSALRARGDDDRRRVQRCPARRARTGRLLKDLETTASRKSTRARRTR
jgi:hypothetical protein